MSPLFRKKPVVVEAWPFDGTWPEADRLVAWIIRGGGEAYCQQSECGGYVGFYIQTLEGQMQVGPGDWVIKGTEGEFYPCRPAAFAATFEAVAPR